MGGAGRDMSDDLIQFQNLHVMQRVLRLKKLLCYKNPLFGHPFFLPISFILTLVSVGFVWKHKTLQISRPISFLCFVFGEMNMFCSRVLAEQS